MTENRRGSGACRSFNFFSVISAPAEPKVFDMKRFVSPAEIEQEEVYAFFNESQIWHFT